MNRAQHVDFFINAHLKAKCKNSFEYLVNYSKKINANVVRRNVIKSSI